MDYLSISDIMERTLPTADVDVPEWGGVVQVRAITQGEITRIYRQATDRSGALNEIKANVLILEAGMLQPKIAPGQYKQFLNKEPGPIARIAAEIITLSGMGTEEEEEPADLGES